MLMQQVGWSPLLQGRNMHLVMYIKMEVPQLQLLFMGLIFLSTTVVGLAPVLMKEFLGRRVLPKKSTRNRILSGATCFGAGVFLFVCFLGLLPAADKKFHHILEHLDGHEWETFAEFPWGFFTVTIGFLVIFTIDKLVHAIEHSKEEYLDSHGDLNLGGGNFLSQPEPIPRTSDLEAKVALNQPNGVEPGHKCPEPCTVDETSGHGVPSSVVFLIALGIHSIFEGMAVGLQTEKDKVLEFSMAVLVHEVVMAFTFGLEVSKSRILRRNQKMMYVCLFTVTIPLGILVGLGLQNAPSENREIISAVCEAFATGIFIHVIFMEILVGEFPGHSHHHHHKNEEDAPHSSEIRIMLEKIFCICAGLLTMILMSVFLHQHERN
ncbi:unnamed protein product, partial [Meganyctiphanes norvegica]